MKERVLAIEAEVLEVAVSFMLNDHTNQLWDNVPKYVSMSIPRSSDN
jgi:hypothetical protein